MSNKWESKHGKAAYVSGCKIVKPPVIQNQVGWKKICVNLALKGQKVEKPTGSHRIKWKNKTENIRSQEWTIKSFNTMSSKNKGCIKMKV